VQEESIIIIIIIIIPIVISSTGVIPKSLSLNGSKDTRKERKLNIYNALI